MPARAAQATGPRPDDQRLRAAYLDVLKLCLCDLAGTATWSVVKGADGRVRSRELTGDELRIRAEGADWPLHGLTMVGLRRLDDLQACVETVVREQVAGDLIEAGTWRGGASILMRATLDALGADDRTVVVADSFQGFPEADEDENLNVVDFLAVPLDEVRDNFARFGLDHGVRFVPGFLEETVGELAGGRWAVLRLDVDTYEATLLALESLYPGLAVGGYVVVDDYRALEPCRRAVDEFRARHGLTEPLEDVDWTCVRWRRESDRPIDGAPATTAAPGADRRRARAPARPTPAAVPTERELRLREKLVRLRRRLADTESELDRLRGSPLSGPLEWLRRRRRSGKEAAR
jgi:O-methyltransferase